MTKGKDFIISIEVDGVMTPICYATDCVIDMNYTQRRVVDDTTRSEKYIGDTSGYTLQVPGLVAYRSVVNIVQLKRWADNHTPLNWQATAFDNGGVVYSGTILITNINKTSQFRDAIKFDMSAVGTGDLVDQLLPINQAVYLADFNAVRLAGCPNPYPVVLYWYNGNGTGPGVMIGVADNADDVLSLFNGYVGNEYFQLTGYSSGCDFSMQAQWDTPYVPDVIYAQPAPELAMWSGTGDEGISPDQDEDELLSPYYS